MGIWDNNIRVDEAKLFSILGGKVHWLGSPTREMAARAITDMGLGDTPESRFIHVLCWLDQAMELGKELGRSEVEKKWRKRLEKIFDL